MKAQLLAIAVVVAIFCGVSHADSCAAGLFSSLEGTTCTIGNMTFAFGDRSGDGNVTPSILTFTPLVTSTSAGFEISGLPAASQVNPVTNFQGFFSAVPSSGMTITSFTAILNGVSAPNSMGQSLTTLGDFGPETIGNAQNDYLGGSQTLRIAGGPRPLGFGTYDDSGQFFIENATDFRVPGTASFTSADFAFNESPVSPVPETSNLADVWNRTPRNPRDDEKKVSPSLASGDERKQGRLARPKMLLAERKIELLRHSDQVRQGIAEQFTETKKRAARCNRLWIGVRPIPCRSRVSLVIKTAESVGATLATCTSVEASFLMNSVQRADEYIGSTIIAPEIG